MRKHKTKRSKHLKTYQPQRGWMYCIIGLGVLAAIGLLCLLLPTTRLDDIKAGGCFKGNPKKYNNRVRSVACRDTRFTGEYYLLKFSDKAASGNYPSDIDIFRQMCDGVNGTFSAPNQQQWKEGQRYVFCYSVTGLGRDT